MNGVLPRAKRPRRASPPRRLKWDPPTLKDQKRIRFTRQTYTLGRARVYVTDKSPFNADEDL